MPGRLSLAQQIALLEEATPVDFDPEDVAIRDLDVENSIAVDPAAREHYVDVGPSSLRRQLDGISDPKYDGVKTTRSQLEKDNESDMGGESGSQSENDDILPSTLEDEDEDPEESDEEYDVEDVGSDEEEEEEEAEEETVPASPMNISKSQKRPTAEDPPRTSDLPSELVKKREEDKKKGKAVSRQIALWDSLLDARIRIQKSVSATNRLPPPLDLKEHLELPECQEALNKLLKESAALSEEIFDLQEYLLQTNESIQQPPRKRRKLDITEATNADYTQWFENATEDIVALEQAYHPHLVQTLAKWSSKIQAVAPSVLLPSNRGAFSSKISQHTKTILQLLDETLSDHTKLLARTQMVRSNGNRIGAPEVVEDNKGPHEDPNVFDDTDFYQQMLRDVIDSKSGTGGDDWMAVQKQKKAKKNVDTKASKGRKLRYEVHEKLQNFMVPVPVASGWHDEQIDELFSSLLGKGFEDVVTGEDGVDPNREEEMGLSEALKDGFRVFG